MDTVQGSRRKSAGGCCPPNLSVQHSHQKPGLVVVLSWVPSSSYVREELRGDRVAAVAVVDHDPVGDRADHAEAPAVFGVLVLVLDLGGRSGASVVCHRYRDHLRRDGDGQVEAAGLQAAGGVEDRVRAGSSERAVRELMSISG